MGKTTTSQRQRVEVKEMDKDNERTVNKVFLKEVNNEKKNR